MRQARKRAPKLAEIVEEIVAVSQDEMGYLTVLHEDKMFRVRAALQMLPSGVILLLEDRPCWQKRNPALAEVRKLDTEGPKE